MIQGAISQLNLTSQDFIMSQIDSGDMPAGIISIANMVKLDNLIIKNFKSFKQQTFTGPFLGFTSIVGPNGSGKSNILDALMFCLCGQNLKHNFFDLREYINREKAESYKDMSKKKKVCCVVANFVLQNGLLLSLKRQLNPQNNETFYINSQEVNKKIYENFLFKQGINPHIPNYAITQGQIDKLLLKEPLQLTRYIQNLSGSFLFKRQYDLIKQQISEVRKNVISMSQKILRLKNEKKTARNLNQASRQCQQLQKQYQDTVNKLFLARVFLRQKDLDQYGQLIAKKRNQEKQRTEQINKKKLRIQEELNQKQQLNRQINTVERRILQLNGKLRNFNRPDLIIKTRQLQSQSKQLSYMENELKSLAQKRQRLEQSIPQIHSSQVVEQYLKLYSQWQSRNRQVNFQLQNKKTLYFNLESQLQFQRSLVQSQLDKERQYLKQQQMRKSAIESAKQQTHQLDQICQRIQTQIKDKQDSSKRNQSLLKQTKQQHQKAQNQVYNLEQLLTENIQTINDKQAMKRLCLVDGFRGIVEHKIRPTHQKYVVAFTVLISSIGKYLLCKDEKSSRLVSEKLRDMNAIRYLVILGNVKRSNVDNSVRQNIGKAASLSIDIIDFDKNLEGMEHFLQQFCRGKVICEDLNTAFQIRNKRIPGLRQIITLNGQVIKNDGTITSCGNAEHVKRTYKIGTNKKSLQGELNKAVKMRDQMKDKLTKLQKECRPEEQIKRNQEIIKMQKKRIQLQEKIKFLSSVKPKEIKSFKIIERDIAMLTEKIQKVQKQIIAIQKSMTKDQQLSQFMKRYNIQNLDSFRSTSNLQALQKQTKTKNQLIRQIDQINDKIQSIKNRIHTRSERIELLQQDLKDGNYSQSKQSIQKQIQENEKGMKELRQKVSKLAVFRQMDIQLRSEVIQMQTKFKFMKQKNRQFIQDLRMQLGVTMNVPRVKADYINLQDYIAQGLLDQLSRKNIEKAINDLQSQKSMGQDKLQKFNSMNLISKSHQKDEADIVTQIKALNDSVQENSKMRSQLQQKLQKVKSQRKAVFLNFFERVKANLKQCYQVLTEIQPGVAGKADMYLESSELPFENGIYFTPTPPTKRFIYDLEQLSGGQKSIASLALQYALAVSSRSPFLVLDESDAYLDSSNSTKLLKLLDDSFKEKKLQIILITHKFSIFSNCESLVGVSRPKQQFSKVFSMKIT